MKIKTIKVFDFLIKKYKWVCVFAILVFIILIWPFTRVNLGYKMVCYNSLNGKIDVKGTGVQFSKPFIDKKIIYPVDEQIYTISRNADNWAKGIDGSIQTQTIDSQNVSIDVSVIYRLDENRLEDIFSFFNDLDINDIEEEHIRLFLNNIINKISSEYTVDEIYSKSRAKFENNVFQELKKQMAPYHILVSNVLIDSVRISEEYQALLNAKLNKEKSIVEAKGISETNKILNETLTEDVLKYKSIDKINDKVKIIVVPSGTDSQLNLGDLYKEIINKEQE